MTLARPDDVDAVAALIESEEVPRDYWPAIEQYVRQRGVVAFAGRARLLGLPVGVLGETGAAAPVVRQIGARVPPPPLTGLFVADL
ncbi:CoA transferase, partial [Mycobacterium sp. ITM-2017-0098]